MFNKSIDRNIKGVIKVGQADEENIKQELEEYVVTRELQKHFAKFFLSYKQGIHGHTDKMGVWISGFFGSGKSHFLKILSYLIENKEVDGKRALDYFIDDRKIVDSIVLADMKLVANIADHTDVVLFNIDSKSDSTGKLSKNAIVSVFLKVFNEMQGYCGSIPYLADLERQLVADNRYEQFKSSFAQHHGKTWESSRHTFDFIQDSIVKVLSDMGFMSESACRNWCEKSTEPYQISIERFTKLVKEYLDRQGANHHVVFMVDEIGQYIGSDSQLMLNLQTITEDLGTTCQGKAWVIVTSQEDIDAITKDMGLRSNDFSKIQGRFDTRLSLSSANVDEVIKKRILEKTDTAEQTLKLLYEQKSTIIKNLIVFNDGVEKKLYTSDQDFAQIYPFVPYQFNLLAGVLTSIRKHGASGKHLSDGNRSMIALFQESAMTIKECDIGKMIPFHKFYNALHQFLDHSHRDVITRALDNTLINPEGEEDCFHVNVLKTLFMIKYVKEITANADNITSLLTDYIDTNRLELKKKVDESLQVLVRQMLVQKNGDIYVFLTNEEQEINREIESQHVEMVDVIALISELIFDDIYSESKYRYSAHHGRYTFPFKQFVDDKLHRSNQNCDIGLSVLTPNAQYDDATLRMKSANDNEVCVLLPSDATYLDELRSVLKIEKYLRVSHTTSLTKHQQIKEAKQSEARSRKEQARLFLMEAMKQADIYVNGDKAHISSKDVASRLQDALGRLVDKVYTKLEYIDTPMDESAIRSLFLTTQQQSLTLEGVAGPNALALQDMLNYISTQSSAHLKTSMKSIMDRFRKAPYGFIEDDIEWLVAKLFKVGEIGLSVNGASIMIHQKSADEIVRYITKKDYIDKLMIERRTKANETQKKSVREVMKEVYEYSIVDEDDTTIMSSFQSKANSLLQELSRIEVMQQSIAYPGKTAVAKGKALLRAVEQMQTPQEFFSKVHQDKEDWFDYAEEYAPVRSFFFKGEQKIFFDKALKLFNTYKDSKTFIANDDVHRYASDIERILTMDKPYSEIPKLPELTEKLTDAYHAILQSMEAPVLKAIDEAKERVFKGLESKSYQAEFSDSFQSQFNKLYEKAESCDNVATLLNIKIEADTLKLNLLNEMTRKDEQLATITVDGTTDGVDSPPSPRVKKRKNMSIRTINVSASWQIESEQELDQYISEMKAKIMKELNEDVIIHLEF